MKGEHRELLRDFINLVINFTPISGVITLGHFLHKWIVKKRGVKRVAVHIHKQAVHGKKAKKVKSYLQKRKRPRIELPETGILFQ